MRKIRKFQYFSETCLCWVWSHFYLRLWLFIHDTAYCTAPAKGGKLLPSAPEREHPVLLSRTCQIGTHPPKGQSPITQDTRETREDTQCPINRYWQLRVTIVSHMTECAYDWCYSYQFPEDRPWLLCWKHWEPQQAFLNRQPLASVPIAFISTHETRHRKETYLGLRTWTCS